MKHQLALDIPFTSNPHVLRIEDSSVYAASIPIECARIEVTAPGYVQPVEIEVDRDFRRKETSCTLQLHQQGCPDSIRPIPDGVYVIRYSVSPNDKVFVEYNHLRMTGIWNRYFEKLGTLHLGDCTPGEELKTTLKEFQLIRSFLEAAKAKVEYSHEPMKGMELFQYAERLLNKHSNCTSC